MNRRNKVVVGLMLALVLVFGIVTSAYAVAAIGTHGPGTITSVERSYNRFTVHYGIFNDKTYYYDGHTIGMSKVVKGRRNTYVTYGREYLANIAIKVW